MARTSRDSTTRREHRPRKHRSTDSNGDLLPRARDPYDYPNSPSSSPKKSRPKRSHKAARPTDSDVSKSTSNPLSTNALSQLDALNEKLGWNEYDGVRAKQREREQEEKTFQDFRKDRRRQEEKEEQRHEKKERRRREHGHEDDRRQRERRVVSGQALERGEYRERHHEKEEYEHRVQRRGGTASDDYDEEARRRKRKRIFLIVIILVIILVIAIAVGVTVSKKSSSSSTGSGGAAVNSTQPANSNLDGVSESSIPASAKGTYLDPFTWYDTTDFNVTYTAETVGGLSVMGLNSTWDDTTQANSRVPALNETWGYGPTTPVRGINLGGWLSIEPVITPSLFSGYTTHDNVVDEWTLSSTLGASKAKSTIEQHYSSFVNEQTFADIQAAGFDHVRIPFSYWAVTTYDGDPYVPQVSWRYLLRAIEWARKYGLRINLDLHGAPGSQNGWNHSGHQGVIGWLNGTNGALNGQRTIDIHNQLSQFFAQPRYKNVIAMYGLVNEPRMVELDVDTVLTWSTNAINTIRNNNITAIIVFGDGFLGLDNWQGKLTGISNILLDVHQYVIFNVEQIVLDHSDKVNFACAGWTQQTEESMNTATGFGPTLCGEWSQADTDCSQYLNNVGVGSRWEGTLNMANTPGGGLNGSVLNPTCPTHNDPQCSCDDANADPSTYSAEYKQWLLDFAEGQMSSFEKGWGWFYWTWQTETATQWSYKAGLAAGILPAKTWERSFNCSTIPDYAGAGLAEYY